MSSDTPSRKAGKVIITIAGNMGVGKTTLTERLAGRLGWQPFREAVEDNPYIADFYKNMERWGFHSQLFYLSRRLRLYREMMAHENPIVVQDRGIFEDAEVFARNLHEQGYMSERDYTVYRDLYRECTRLMPMPGFVVYLKATVPTLLKRIESRGQEYERNVPADYLHRLNTLYDEWILHFSLCPTITIPVDELDFAASEQDLAIVEQHIIKALEGERQEQLAL